MQFNDANFEEEVLKSEKPVVVDFYADWCQPCKIMAPIINQIEKDHPELKVGKINIDENTATALEYRVLSIPTILFVKDGKVIGRAEGAVPKDYVEQKIKKYFG